MTTTEPRYKMVNGELVELTPEEIAGLEHMAREAKKNPPPWAAEQSEEKPDARSRSRR